MGEVCASAAQSSWPRLVRLPQNPYAGRFEPDLLSFMDPPARVFRRKRERIGKHLVKRHGIRVTRIGRSGPSVWRHVGERAGTERSRLQGGVRRQTKACEANASVVADEQVLRLDTSVDKARLMGTAYRGCDSDREVKKGRCCERAAKEADQQIATRSSRTSVGRPFRRSKATGRTAHLESSLVASLCSRSSCPVVWCSGCADTGVTESKWPPMSP